MSYATSDYAHGAQAYLFFRQEYSPRAVKDERGSPVAARVEVVDVGEVPPRVADGATANVG